MVCRCNCDVFWLITVLMDHIPKVVTFAHVSDYSLVDISFISLAVVVSLALCTVLGHIRYECSDVFTLYVRAVIDGA